MLVAVDDTGAMEQTAASSPPSLDVRTELALDNVLARLKVRRGPPTIGRYEIGSELGAGGFGAVYAAYDPSLDRQVAVKLVLPKGPEAAEAQARLLREAKSLAKLGHPHVVEIFDVGVQPAEAGRGERVFIVMELLSGPTLKAWVTKTKPAPEAIVRAFAEAADGLAAAHSVGVVHRDFKPANAMLAADGTVKVLDFGLAREDQTLSSPHEPTEPGRAMDSLTRTGTVMGTPRYMSPQQHAGRSGTAACDQYAVCISLWEALVGKPPFDGLTLAELAADKREGPPARPESIPPPVYAVLRRGLAVEPGDRWPSMTALAEALRGRRARARRYLWPLVLGTGTALAVAGVWASSKVGPAVGCIDALPTRGEAYDEIVERTREADDANVAYHPRVRSRLDRFDVDFAAARERACGSGAAPASEAPAQQACLQRAAAAREALVNERDALRPLDLATRVLGLARPIRCVTEDPQPLFQRTRAEDDELAAMVAQTVRSGDAERPRLDREHVRGLVSRARELGDVYTATVLLRATNGADLSAGRNEQVVRQMQEAVWLAEQARDDLLATEIWPTLLSSMSDASLDDAELQTAFDRAEGALERAGHPRFGTAGLCASAALREIRRGDLDAARAAADRGIAAAGGQSPEPGAARHLGMLWLARGISDWDRGDAATAKASLGRVLELAPEDVTWGQAVLAPALRMLAEIAAEEGDTARQLALMVRQQHFTSLVASPEHPSAIYGDAQIGRALAMGGRHEDGLRRLTTAYRRIADQAGEQTAMLGHVAMWTVDAALVAGKPDVAITYAKELATLTAAAEMASPSRAEAHGYLLAAYVAAGDTAAARESLPHVPGPDEWTYDPIRIGLGRLAYAEGRYADATQQALLVLEELPPHERKPEDDLSRVAVYELLAAIARAEGRTEDAAAFDVLADERRVDGPVVPALTD